MKQIRYFLASLKPLAVALTAAPLMAHAWTEKPVHVVVPAPAGGTVDVVARILSEAVSKEIEQPVVVDNKPGAIGVQALLQAPSDGQAIMFIASNILTEIPLVMKTSFDPMKDVTPVTMVAQATMALVSAPTVPAQDLKGLIAYLKTGKGSPASFASYSAGTSSNYAGAIFAKKAGLDLQHVPFAGSPPALQNLMGGQVDIMFDGLVTSLPMIKAGKLKVFGVGYGSRLAQLPDVPTMAEQGFPEINFSNWVGAIVSSKMPDDLVQRINAVLTKVASSPEVKEKLIAQNFAPMVSKGPEELAKMTRDEYERNAQIVKAYDIKLNQ
jgi:tripartite-type tricarboxylate transporter receptor subunit TctC